MPTVSTTYWGEPYTLYESYNVRTGTSNLTDPDFTDFPPFVRNNMRGAETPNTASGTLYSAYLNNLDGWSPSNPYPDLSIAYCGVKNPDLPICNTVAIGWDDNIDSHDYANPKVCFKTDPNDIKPIMFLSKKRYMEQKAAHNLVADVDYNQFYNPYYEVSGSYFYGMYFWSPNYVQMSGSDLWSKRNISGDMAYWRSIGLRTVFGVIYVRYYDRTTEWHNTREVPTTTHLVTLHWYESQTAEWKATKKVVGAIMTMQIRKNKNGTYGVMANNDSIVPDITIGMSAVKECFPSQPDEKLPIYSPVSSIDNYGYCYDFPLFGSRSEGGITNYDDRTMRASDKFGVLVGYRDSIFKHGSINADSDTYKRRIWLEVDGDSDLEFIRQSAASYGLFFTDGDSSDSGYADLFSSGHDTDRWYNDKMCLGVVDSDGYTDGTYTRGLLNATAPNWSWKDTNQSAYDPSLPPIPENHYSTQTEFNSIGDLASLTKRYVLNATGVESLGAALWDITADLIDSGGTPDYSELNEKILDQFLTNNPIDCIVGLQRYPMAIPTVGTDTVKLGKTDTGISCKPMEKTAFYYLFEGNTIAPKFGDSFLDYEPYTKMELYVPFCGTIQLNPADILNRKLNVQLAVDFTTGTATGFIMSDDLVIETVNGNIAIDLPITGIQAATVASQLNNAIANKMNRSLTRETATLGRISVQGLLRTISNPLAAHNEGEIAKNEETRADYELTHQNAPIHIIGSASAVGGWCIDLKCRLLIYYPTGEILRNANPPEWENTQLARYGKNTGFACCMEKSIGSMNSGLVLGINPDLSGMVTNSAAANPATASELELIRSAIAEGVIVPLI